MSLQFMLAWRYLMGRKLRTGLTTLAIALGVTVLGLNALIPAVRDSFRQSLMATTGQVDLTVTSETRGVFGASAVDQVRATQGVAQATGSLVRAAMLSGDQALKAADGTTVTMLNVHGVDPDSVAQVRPLSLSQGRLLQPGDGNVLLIGTGLAEKTGLQPGDRISLPSATGVTEFEVAGIVAERPTAGTEEVYMPLSAAQALFNQPGSINTIEAKVTPGSDTEAVGQAVLAALGSGFKLGGNVAGAEFMTATEMGDTVFRVLGILALIMGGFIILITFRTIVVERRTDIGMLRALGASRRTIIGLIASESLLQGAVGTAVGLVAGQLLAHGAVALIQPTWVGLVGFPMGRPSLSIGDVALAVGLGLGVTLVAALRPAMAAGSVPPLEALRPSVGKVTWRTAAKRSIWGGVLIALALLGLATGKMALASVGILLFLAGLIAAAPVLVLPVSEIMGRLLSLVLAQEGRIAEGNVVRQPNRAATTAATMMIGLAIVLALVSMVTSMLGGVWQFMDKSLGSDYLLMPQSLVLGGGNVGAGPELAQALRDTPGVAAVTTLRQSTAQVAGQDLQVIGIDPATYAQISSLSFSAGNAEEAFAALGKGRAIIVNGIFAGQSGVHVGQELTLTTPAGPQTYRVAGVASDYLNYKLATAYISQANLAQDFHETSDLLLMADRTPGADPNTVHAALQAVTARYPTFTLYSTAEFAQSQRNAFSALQGALYMLVFVLAIPSLIGLVNTLAISVLERRREIGMLRAVGATRKQVRRIVLGESLLLAALGTAFGILAGLWLGYVMVSAISIMGFNNPYSLPGAGILLTIAVGLIFGVIGALIPARQAARMDVVSALQYE